MPFWTFLYEDEQALLVSPYTGLIQKRVLLPLKREFGLMSLYLDALTKDEITGFPYFHK